MTFPESLATLCRLIEESKGRPIPLGNGKSRSFSRFRMYDEGALASFEAAMQVHLPSAFREFLLKVGACQLYHGSEKIAVGIEFPDIAALKENFYIPLGVDQHSGLFPIATDLLLQEIAIFQLHRRGDRNFLNISHEYHPDDWEAVADELGGWRRFEDWIVEVVSQHGETDVH
jgi:hypothetical protein